MFTVILMKCNKSECDISCLIRSFLTVCGEMLHLPMRASEDAVHRHTHAHTQTQLTFCDWVKEAIEGFSQVKEHFLINDDKP